MQRDTRQVDREKFSDPAGPRTVVTIDIASLDRFSRRRIEDLCRKYMVGVDQVAGVFAPDFAAPIERRDFARIEHLLRHIDSHNPFGAIQGSYVPSEECTDDACPLHHLPVFVCASGDEEEDDVPCPSDDEMTEINRRNVEDARRESEG